MNPFSIVCPAGYVKHLEDDVVESAFYRGILAIHNENFEAAALHIDHARRLLDNRHVPFSFFIFIYGDMYPYGFACRVLLYPMPRLSVVD